MKELVRKILKEEVNDKIIKKINTIGLYNFLRLSKLSYTKLFWMVGDEWLTNQIMIDFIRDAIRNYGSFSVDEIGADPVFYGRTDDEYREISYFGVNYVWVDVYDDTDTKLGEFRVQYENLSHNILKDCFDFVNLAYQEGLLSN